MVAIRSPLAFALSMSAGLHHVPPDLQLPKIDIEVVSDTTCPYCSVGKAKLERAMRSYSGRANFQVRWSPYILHAELRQSGPMDKAAHYKKRFGLDRAATLIQEQRDLFKVEGLAFSLDGVISDTLDSHRLVSWVGREYGFDKQNALVGELFDTYFGLCKDISDVRVLADVAERLGVADAGEFLSDPTRGLKEVQSELTRTQVARAVPHFVVNAGKYGPYSLVGLKDPAVFAKVFDEILTPDDD